MKARAYVLLLTPVVMLLAAEQPGTKKEVPADREKKIIEIPLKNVIANIAPEAQRFQPKNDIEAPTKQLLASSTSDFTNPKVSPGDVSWHEDFETACAAAKVSKKPVLLFQLMGNLDDQFC